MRHAAGAGEYDEDRRRQECTQCQRAVSVLLPFYAIAQKRLIVPNA
jgi:hypothetical protein